MGIDFSLYLITDRRLSQERRISEIVSAAIRGGVTCVQVREKESTGKEFFDVSQSVKKVVHGENIPLIINDRIDIALAVGADGVHVGQDDLPVNNKQ